MAFLKANILCSLKSVKSKIAYVTSCISVFVHIVRVDNLCRDFLVRIGNGRALHTILHTAGKLYYFQIKVIHKYIILQECFP